MAGSGVSKGILGEVLRKTKRLGPWLRKRLARAVGKIRKMLAPKGHAPAIQKTAPASAQPTPVDRYWGRHTVKDPQAWTAERSEAYLEWRFNKYPLFRNYARLYDDHEGEVILDHGCGPGNDLVGFLLHSKAKKVIGVDVSAKALKMAAQRIALHHIDPERIELIHTTDASNRIPLEDKSVDYVQSLGVVHHMTQPEAVLHEFYRILKPGGRATIMVYNQHSIFLHLFTAYQRMILDEAYPGLSLQESFRRSTDGPECPISRYYAPHEFVALCQAAGFKADYVGAYFNELELRLLKAIGEQALADPRLAEKHKQFLRDLSPDPNDYPLYDGKHAGMSGVFWLTKSSSENPFK
jgi:ubiquinone/menaquinone biosynthesis C-methylase UbiE